MLTRSLHICIVTLLKADGTQNLITNRQRSRDKCCIWHLHMKCYPKVYLPCRWGLEYADCIHCRRIKPLLKGVFWVRYLTASDGEAKVLELRGVWSTPSLPLLPGTLCPKMVAYVKVPSIGQIHMFKSYLYFTEILETI